MLYQHHTLLMTDAAGKLEDKHKALVQEVSVAKGWCGVVLSCTASYKASRCYATKPSGKAVLQTQHSLLQLCKPACSASTSLSKGGEHGLPKKCTDRPACRIAVATGAGAGARARAPKPIVAKGMAVVVKRIAEHVYKSEPGQGQGQGQVDAYSCGVEVPKMPESPAYTRWLLSTDLTKLEADSSHVCRGNSNLLSQVV